MPIYYNTAPPTPTTKNTINSIMATLPNIRDFLLLKNLAPQYPFLGTTTNGSPKIGQPVLDTMVGTGSNAVPIGLPLETEGILWKEQNVLPNMFKNVDSTANSLTSIDYIPDVPFADGYGSSVQWPQGIQSYPRYVVDDVKKYGIYGKTVNAEFKKDNIIKNKYLDSAESKDVGDFITLQPVNATEQTHSYIESYGEMKYGGLNLNGDNKTGVKASNIIGSIASGGLGLAKGGIIPNFDVRSSLAGRVLGAAGLMKDTRLGLIGGQQLALALANNAAFNLQQDILGALNIQDNVLSLVKGAGFAGFPRPNYNITIPGSGAGRAADYTSKLLGFTIPRSYVTDEGSIFQSESGEVTNIDRANALIETTGKGQLQALLANVNVNLIGISPKGYDNPKYSTFRSGYAPGYKNSNKRRNEDTLTANMYAFQKGNSMVNIFSKEEGKKDGVIFDLSYLREEKISGYGFKSPEETATGPLGNAGYDERKISDVGFTWTSNPSTKTVNSRSDYDEIIGEKKSLLVKTQKLFNSVGMRNIVSNKGDMNKNSTQLTQANGKGFSKGNAVMSKGMFGYVDPNDPKKILQPGQWNRSEKTADDTYCRSWTTLSRYDSIAGEEDGDTPGNRSGLVRNDGLYTDKQVPFRLNTENSVLEDTGFVKMAPYNEDFNNPELNYEVPRKAKNYMLSIENLAWHDRKEMLPKGELGQGDPITGKQGRMMWFPPYDIQFSESVSVDWESHKFIGRGENMYTYNNTERSGQLSFKIIVDHSTYTNTFRDPLGPDDHYVASFMAGCIEPDSIWTDKFTVSQVSRTVKNTVTIPQKTVEPPKETPPGDFYVFFPNDQASLPDGYESGVTGYTEGHLPDKNQRINYDVNGEGTGCGLGSYPSKFTYKKGVEDCTNNNGAHEEWPDRKNFGLNFMGPKTPITKIGDTDYKGYWAIYSAISEYIETKCPHCRVEVTGHASPQGRKACNQQLSDARADLIVHTLQTQWAPGWGWTPDQAKERIKKMKSYQIPESESTCNPKTGSDTDTFGCKYDRRVRVHFEYDAGLASKEIVQPKPCTETTTETFKDTVRQKFYNETMFFDRLKRKDKFIFDSFREKIKFFHPAFHSTTPEGLNSRLTFLQQCTRQGPTDNMETNNLAFGRPPVCILRIGDFYHTKIIIDSLNIEYEPLVWDLNPEGIGVQPMIANVSLSFKFIGGESLYGPINKLQNALSFNYYANAGVYEGRADYISQQKPTGITGDSATGMYLNNGLPSTKDGVITASELISSVKASDCDPSQTAMNNTALTNQQPVSASTSGTTSGTTEPKIIGIDVAGVDWAQSDSVAGSETYKNEPTFANKYFIYVRLKSEGIEKFTDHLISDDKLTEFVSKGIKFVIETSPTPDNESRYEEIVEWNVDSTTKKTWDLFTGIYYIGYECSFCFHNETIVELDKKGNYNLSVYYDGQKIQTIPIIVGTTSFTTL